MRESEIRGLEINLKHPVSWNVADGQSSRFVLELLNKKPVNNNSPNDCIMDIFGKPNIEGQSQFHNNQVGIINKSATNTTTPAPNTTHPMTFGIFPILFHLFNPDIIAIINIPIIRYCYNLLIVRLVLPNLPYQNLIVCHDIR
jgi:hypothetical protein